MSEKLSQTDLAAIFAQAPFVELLGIRFLHSGEGWVEAEMPLLAHHMQHLGAGHAGATATLADHCAGTAAATLIKRGQNVVTVEFKLNLLRPAKGERLHCRAEVLKAGRTFSTVEASVYAHDAGKQALIAKLNATIAIV